MPAITENKKVSDMTAGELKALIKDTINKLLEGEDLEKLGKVIK